MGRAPSAAAWVAGIVPVLVVASWVGWALRPPTNVPSEAVAAMDARLRVRDPEVVVLGNSSTRLAIDEDRLAAALDRRVSLLAVDGFASGGWYALLRHRVVEAGYRPRVVVVASAPGFALRAGSPEPLAAQRLAEHLGPDDHVLAERLGVASGPAERWRRNRVEARASVLAGVRTIVGWAWLGPVPPNVARGTVEQALLASLGTLGVTDPAAPGGAAPALTAGAGAEVGWHASLLPELAAEVAGLGSRLVVVLLPARGHDATAEVAALRAGLAAWPRAEVVDLSAVALPDDAWLDPTHLSPRGREALLPALSEALAGGGPP